MEKQSDYRLLSVDNLLRQADGGCTGLMETVDAFSVVQDNSARGSDENNDAVMAPESDDPEKDHVCIPIGLDDSTTHDKSRNAAHTQFCVMNTDSDTFAATGVVTLKAEPLFQTQHNAGSYAGLDTDVMDCVSLDDSDVTKDLDVDWSTGSQQDGGYTSLDRPGTPVPYQYMQTASQMSSCSDILPVCRFCQQHEENNDPLFAPCRCAGSLQYIHHSCLLRWIEICTKNSRKPPRCEICEYQFHRHKTFKFRQWKLPPVSRKDKFLHMIFIFNLFVMIGCATATIMCFLSDKGHISKFPKNKMHLSTEEIITLSCGVLFFISFFITMSVEIKAKENIYKLFMKFLMMSMSWEIEEYDKRHDIEERLLCEKDPNCV